jgi:glutamine synthetase
VGEKLVVPEASLPTHWHTALERFRESELFPRFLGEDYCRAFAAVRQGECDDFHFCIPDLDYEWYLRAL